MTNPLAIAYQSFLWAGTFIMIALILYTIVNGIVHKLKSRGEEHE